MSLYIPRPIRSLETLKTVIINSIKILKHNPKSFLSIFTLTTLPLSFLLYTLSVISQPLLNQIYEKESITLFVHTRYEAREIWKEVRVDAVSYIDIQLLFSIPCYILSVSALIMSVHVTALAYNVKQLDFVMVVKAVMMTWKKQLVVTSIIVYIILFTYCVLTRVALLLVGEGYVRLLTWIFLVILEVVLVAVLSMGIVVSVLEERSGLEAVNVEWVLMEGRWFCGWILTSLLVLMTSGIRWGFRIVMHSQGYASLVYKVGLICVLGLVILWSYVLNTVFYCECNKQQVDKVENKLLI